MKIDIDIHDEAVQAGLREVQARSREEAYQIVRRAAQRQIEPVARAVAPHIVAHTVVVKASRKGATLTTDAKGQKRAIFVLLQEGGVVRAPIRPQHAQALHFAGRYAGLVKGPRKYRGKHFLEKAVAIASGPFEHDIGQQVYEFLARDITGSGGGVGFATR